MPYKSNVSVLIEHLQQNPSTDVTDREFENCILKFGSYICLKKNRILNQVSMLVEVIRDRELQQDFCDYFSCENFNIALSLVFTYNPQLVKSKAIKDNIKAWKQYGFKKHRKAI